MYREQDAGVSDMEGDIDSGILGMGGYAGVQGQMNWNSEVKELRSQGLGRAIYMDIGVTKNDEKAWIGEDDAKVW